MLGMERISLCSIACKWSCACDTKGSRLKLRRCVLPGNAVSAVQACSRLSPPPFRDRKSSSGTFGKSHATSSEVLIAGT